MPAPKGEGMDALLIAAGPPKLGGEKEGGDIGESPGGAKVRAARRLRQALASKNDGQVAAAFKEMYNICAAEHGSGGGEEDAEGGELEEEY